MTPTRTSDRSNTYHPDGTVSLWDCIQQRWIRTHRVSDAVMATLTPAERTRIEKHTALNYHVRAVEYDVDGDGDSRVYILTVDTPQGEKRVHLDDVIAAIHDPCAGAFDPTGRIYAGLRTEAERMIAQGAARPLPGVRGRGGVDPLAGFHAHG